MKNRFVISENDRRSILSMYGLLKEDITKINISGTIKDSEGKLKVFENIRLKDINDEILTTTQSDGNGKYNISYNLDSEKQYFIYVHGNEKIEITDKKTTPQKIDIDLTGSKALSDVSVAMFKTFNLEIDVLYLKNKLSDYNLKIINSKNEEVFSIENTNMNNFIFTQKGIEVNGLEENKEYKVPNEPVLNKDEEITIKVSKDGFVTKSVKDKFVFNSTVKLTSKTVNSDKFVIKTENLDFKSNVREKVLFNIEKNLLLLKITDINNNTIEGAKISMLNSDDIFTTDKNGEVNIPFEYDQIENKNIQSIVRKENYKSQSSKFEIKEGFNDKTIFLKSSLEDESLIEPLDDYKDNFFEIYGKSETDLSYNESLKMAKLNAINKFIERNKKRYIEFGKLENIDPEITYELVYGRPKKISNRTGKFFNIVKLKRKDIKNFLIEYAKSKNLKINKTKKTMMDFFDGNNISLPEAIKESFRNNQKIFVVLGKTENDLFNELLEKIENSNYYKLITNGGYLPLYIPVDKNNENYKMLKNQDNMNKQPRVLVLKPESYSKFEIENNNLEI